MEFQFQPGSYNVGVHDSSSKLNGTEISRNWEAKLVKTQVTRYIKKWVSSSEKHHIASIYNSI